MEKNPVFFGLCGIRKIGKGGNWASDNLTHTMKHITSVVSRRFFYHSGRASSFRFLITSLGKSIYNTSINQFSLNKVQSVATRKLQEENI
ncbi:hypothetical protein SFRURICE_003959 [Spodoptera frugiperda]|nr:hypothetical protein SFRURICE_003959 [Spodoptera frugiperda]